MSRAPNPGELQLASEASPPKAETDSSTPSLNVVPSLFEPDIVEILPTRPPVAAVAPKISPKPPVAKSTEVKALDPGWLAISAVESVVGVRALVRYGAPLAFNPE